MQEGWDRELVCNVAYVAQHFHPWTIGSIITSLVTASWHIYVDKKDNHFETPNIPTRMLWGFELKPSGLIPANFLWNDALARNNAYWLRVTCYLHFTLFMVAVCLWKSWLSLTHKETDTAHTKHQSTGAHSGTELATRGARPEITPELFLFFCHFFQLLRCEEGWGTEPQSNPQCYSGIIVAKCYWQSYLK